MPQSRLIPDVTPCRTSAFARARSFGRACLPTATDGLDQSISFLLNEGGIKVDLHLVDQYRLRGD